MIILTLYGYELIIILLLIALDGCELVVFKNACGVDKKCAKVYYPQMCTTRCTRYGQNVYKCAQVVHSKYDKLGYSLGKLSSFPKQFPSGTQAVSKLVHHLDMYVHKRVSKLRTAYFCAVLSPEFVEQ